ncbi:MAG: carbohydrate-binding protein, partial [Bacillus sp. (in: Bacteria)]|nr:carbohydrate-binding protein [Bacillus sp. (in: firmicutes)]
MILNNEQLRARAHEFALTHELFASSQLTARYWPSFRNDMASLHKFAEMLGNNRVECKQPAEDWLLDHINFIETQSQVVLRELPRSLFKQLPKLRSTGLPRIYDLCNDYLDHVDGIYDIHSFESYLASYQEVSILKDTECWVLPSAIRVIIIHRLAAVMQEVQNRHQVCQSITSMLDQIDGKNFSDSKIRHLLEHETRKKTLSPVQIVHYVQHLSEWEPNIRIVHDWLRAHVENSESSLESMISLEHQLQAELQVTCGNLVKSLHTLERLPWRSVFTRISHIEQILQSDPTGEYQGLDLPSSDLLRKRVARIAHKLNVPETVVAQTAVKLAKVQQGAASKAELLPRAASLAYYLLDPHGITAMRTELCKVARPRILPHLAVRRQPSVVYLLGFLILFATLMLLVGGWITFGINVRPLSWLVIFVALILPISEWVVTIIHEAICKYSHPTPLLRFDFSKKLPEDARTMVVMPIIWSSIAEVDDVVDKLLVHYLANRQPNIYFGILADFFDASTETIPTDEGMVAHAIERIDALRKQYGSDKFFLFHRSRQFNEVDKIYMGWERKRGKLVEFVELLSGSDQTSYTTVYGQSEILKTFRYVFTTDYDTQLPIGVVSRLAGTIHFPYNRPRLNHDETRVIEGFGVLQPRIGVSFESIQNSRFTALWAGEPGIDPYAFAVSNAYQDLFGQAIFVGKGIFDVDSFRKTLVDRIPNHHVLSHDLLEGGFLRTGLTSDIEVVESHPSTFYAHEQRTHRWIRGDWQLIKWLGGKCKDRYGENKRIVLGGLTRWQIADNLRRSLLAPALIIVAILGLNTLPGQSWVWETVVVLTIFLPFLHSLVLALPGKRHIHTLGISFMQSAVQLLTLPFSAVLSIDAIFRTLFRMYISRRNLLEWVTSAETDRHSDKGRVFIYEPAGYMVIILF